MKDFKEIKDELERAENELSERKLNLGTQYINGVIAALRWILFGDDSPIS